jgi:hypothetical protein
MMVDRVEVDHNNEDVENMIMIDYNKSQVVCNCEVVVIVVVVVTAAMVVAALLPC